MTEEVRRQRADEGKENEEDEAEASASADLKRAGKDHFFHQRYCSLPKAKKPLGAPVL